VIVNLEQTIEKIVFKFSGKYMDQIKKIGLVRPMGNTLRVRLLGNSGQLFRKARVLLIGLTHCIVILLLYFIVIPENNCIFIYFQD
jgi:hypothetical protein